jgi:GSH-dependent disulfide-bond oxidoreductase
MIDLYQWTTPKGHKSTIALAEFGVECRNVVVNILAGEEFRPGFLRMSPNNRIPAIVDHDLAAARGLLSVFESGAVLEYLADNTGQLLATAIRVRLETLRWLYWQVVGLGPTKGGHHHFAHYAPERIAYATECDLNETGRLYRVLDERLWDSDYIAEAYSIPTSRAIRGLGCTLVKASTWRTSGWFDALSDRLAVDGAHPNADTINAAPIVAKRACDIAAGARPGVTLPDVYCALHAKDHPYFRMSREARFGTTLEALAAH